MGKRYFLWLVLATAILALAVIVHEVAGFSQVQARAENTVAQTAERVPETVRWKMLINAVRRYQYSVGDLPASLDRLANEGFLFFDPGLEGLSWDTSGDTLTVGARVERNGRVTEVSTQFFKPRSEDYDSWLSMMRLEMWEYISEDRGKGIYPEGLTEQDVMSGRFSMYYYDKLRAHTSSPEEFHQLMWSCELASLLGVSLRLYSIQYDGRFPADVAELFSWIGPRITKGWESPIGGSLVSVGDTFKGENIAYLPKPDLTGFQLFVPLFGAGTLTPPEGMLLSEKWGLHPGEYVYKASGISSAEDTSLNY